VDRVGDSTLSLLATLSTWPWPVNGSLAVRAKKCAAKAKCMQSQQLGPLLQGTIFLFGLHGELCVSFSM